MRSSSTPNRFVRYLYTGAVLCVVEKTAWAATKGRIPDEDKGYTQWLVALGALLLVCLPALINPKRSHLG